MSKKFVTDDTVSRTAAQPTYQMVWHPLEGKGYSSAFLPHIKELEAKLLKEAKEKALFLEKEAYEKGFAQGEKDGSELGQKRLETIMQQFKNLIGEIEKQREELYRAHEAEILGLILNICKKILHREVQLQQEVILDTLREAFKYVVDRRKIILHLNPTDYEYLLAHSDRFSLSLKDMEGVKMAQDPSITRGGCFLETAFGDIDGTIESQFDQIVSLVWKRFEQPE